MITYAAGAADPGPRRSPRSSPRPALEPAHERGDRRGRRPVRARLPRPELDLAGIVHLEFRRRRERELLLQDLLRPDRRRVRRPLLVRLLPARRRTDVDRDHRDLEPAEQRLRVDRRQGRDTELRRQRRRGRLPGHPGGGAAGQERDHQPGGHHRQQCLGGPGRLPPRQRRQRVPVERDAQLRRGHPRQPGPCLVGGGVHPHLRPVLGLHRDGRLLLLRRGQSPLRRRDHERLRRGHRSVRPAVRPGASQHRRHWHPAHRLQRRHHHQPDHHRAERGAAADQPDLLRLEAGHGHHRRQRHRLRGRPDQLPD